MTKIAESQDRRNFKKRACAICNLHSLYNFGLVIHENVLVFSQSEAPNFFMYTITLKSD